MDENLQKPRPEPKRTSVFGRSTFKAFELGFFSGGVAHTVIDGFRTKSFHWKNTLLNSTITGVVFSLAHLIFRKAEPILTTEILSSLPPQLPITQPEHILALNQVPQILDLLVAGGKLTAEQQAKILTEIGNGRKAFAAEIAVADGYITKDIVDQALLRQSTLKVDAAARDLQTIKQSGSLNGMRVNWGNNGVNPAAAHPTRADGAIAAANDAQNLVALFNADPTDPQLSQQLSDGVVAAISLAKGIAQGDSAVSPIAKMGDQWRKTVHDALIAGAHAHPELMKYNHGDKPADIHTYISARNAEIEAAIQQTLEQSPGKENGFTR